METLVPGGPLLGVMEVTVGQVLSGICPAQISEGFGQETYKEIQ